MPRFFDLLPRFFLCCFALWQFDSEVYGDFAVGALASDCWQLISWWRIGGSTTDPPSKSVDDQLMISWWWSPRKSVDGFWDFRDRGDTCDFDFCEECYLEQLNSRRCRNGHLLVSLGTSKDNGWGCDGASEGGCRSKDRSLLCQTSIFLHSVWWPMALDVVNEWLIQS